MESCSSELRRSERIGPPPELSRCWPAPRKESLPDRCWRKLRALLNQEKSSSLDSSKGSSERLASLGAFTYFTPSGAMPCTGRGLFWLRLDRSLSNRCAPSK